MQTRTLPDHRHNGRFATSSFWSEHDPALRRAAEDGLTAAETARRLGVTKNAAIGRADRTGLRWARGKEPAPPATTDPFPPRDSCLYPHGDPGAEDFRFCGDETVEPGHPYCAEHHLLCYQRIPPPKIKLGGRDR